MRRSPLRSNILAVAVGVDRWEYWISARGGGDRQFAPINVRIGGARRVVLDGVRVGWVGGHMAMIVKCTGVRHVQIDDGNLSLKL